MVSVKLMTKYNKGIYEWLIVRLSAISIVIDIIYISNFIFFTNNLSYDQWYDFFSRYSVKGLNTTTLLFILIHSWIGMRHILEDYIKSVFLKRLGIGFICAILYIYLLLGIMIIWSV